MEQLDSSQQIGRTGQLPPLRGLLVLVCGASHLTQANSYWNLSMAGL